MNIRAQKHNRQQQEAASGIRGFVTNRHAMSRAQDLHRALGNQATQRLLQSKAKETGAGSDTSVPTRPPRSAIHISVPHKAPTGLQAKLNVNAPGDIHEQEADLVAEQVMSTSESQVQRALAGDEGGGCAESPNEQPARIQTKPIQTNAIGDMAAPPVVSEVLNTSGQPLDSSAREFMEPRFGHDFSHVRVHTDTRAAESAQEINALAYTVGRDVVFGEGQYAPQTSAGRQLLAHELTHVVQQATGAAPSSGLRAPAVQRQEGPTDAGFPAIAGVPELPDPAKMKDEELGPALWEAQETNDAYSVERIEDEMEKRVSGWGAGMPGPEPVTQGRGAVTPDVALKFLDNMSRGQMPWKPQEGLGGSAWFTTEGEPYTSVRPDKSINVEVEISKGKNPLIFTEADLIKIYEAEAGPAAAQAEAEYRAKFKVDPTTKLSNRAQKAISRVLSKGGGRGGLIEKRMWTRVGEKVAASASKVGEVVLEPGSRFSEKPGKFAVVADASKITLKGGIEPVVEALTKAGHSAEPATVAAAEALASKMKWAGRVRAVFRYGGRVLIVVGVTTDIINIFRAKDTLKAVVTTAGGWAGAAAFGGAFAAWFAPADTAGPVAWAAHGVGTLIAGGIGYFVGSETTKYIYELAVE